MRRSALLALALVAIVAAPAAADDGGNRFHRTTPRAALDTEAGALIIGVPPGRAWGIESQLRLLAPDGALAVRLAVDDDAVREAFVRIAYYASATGRPRQIAIADSVAVTAGERRLLLVALDPPPGALAYRVRVLARLRGDAEGSRPDGIRVSVTAADAAAKRFGSLFSRLLPDGP